MNNILNLQKYIKKHLPALFCIIATTGVTANVSAANYVSDADVKIDVNKADEMSITPTKYNSNLDRLIKLAKTDPIELLEWSMSLYTKNVKDYSAVLHKQERIDGELRKPQDIEFWFKEKPYSLYMQWVNNPGAIDRLLYIEGLNDGHMLVHPTGAFSWLKSVKRKPKCPQALETSLRTADEFGFYRAMRSLHKTFSEAGKKQKYKIKYLGPAKVYGRQSVGMEVTIPRKNNESGLRMFIFFDTEHILPIKYECYNEKGKLKSKYAFSKLKINTGTTGDILCRAKDKF